MVASSWVASSTYNIQVHHRQTHRTRRDHHPHTFHISIGHHLPRHVHYRCIIIVIASSSSSHHRHRKFIILIASSSSSHHHHRRRFIISHHRHLNVAFIDSASSVVRYHHRVFKWSSHNDIKNYDHHHSFTNVIMSSIFSIAHGLIIIIKSHNPFIISTITIRISSSIRDQQIRALHSLKYLLS
ncbi:hypothetical protein Tco_0394719 [Tanacetum coccineum]